METLLPDDICNLIYNNIFKEMFFEVTKQIKSINYVGNDTYSTIKIGKRSVQYFLEVIDVSDIDTLSRILTHIPSDVLRVYSKNSFCMIQMNSHNMIVISCY